MNTIKKLIAGLALASGLFASSSCQKDPLDLSPIDYYGSGNFWTTEAQFDGYIYTLNSYLRNLNTTHTLTFGELRGGLYKTGTGSTDGSTRLGGDIITQNFDEDHTGVSTFGGYYGAITQTNLFLLRTEATTILPEAKKNNYLAIAYGIRAFLYFDLYRVYGEVPLRLDVKVIDGEIDPLKLYMARNSCDEVMAQIKADIAKSLEYFGDNKAWDSYSHGSKITWSKAATEYLAGEVYLWNAKVDMAGNLGTHKAEPKDIDTAKTYFESVVNNYGLALQPSYSDVFSATNKANNEVIFAIRYKEDEASHSFASSFTYMSDGRGLLMEQLNKDAERYGDPLDQRGSGGQWYEYLNEMYSSRNAADTRLYACFAPCYDKARYASTGLLELLTIPVGKNVGHVNAAGVHIWDGDQIYYRLAGAYLALAEIYNYKGDNTNVELYMNKIRERAFGTNYEANKFTAGSFKQNELAILAEKDIEMLQEGQRWWDVCRMTTVKGGAVTDHLIFCDEIMNNQALLKTTETHKLLWPLDKTILGNDPELKQTVGYATK